MHVRDNENYFRLEFINRMGQKVSLAHTVHLLLSRTNNLVIAGFRMTEKPMDEWVQRINFIIRTLHFNVIANNYNYLNHYTIFTCFEFSLWDSSLVFYHTSLAGRYQAAVNSFALHGNIILTA